MTLPTVTSLSLTGDSIKAAAKHLPKLKELVMYGFLPVPKPGVLSSIATGCPLLTRLDISYCRLNATVCEAIAMVSSPFIFPPPRGCLPKLMHHQMKNLEFLDLSEAEMGIRYSHKVPLVSSSLKTLKMERIVRWQ